MIGIDSGFEEDIVILIDDYVAVLCSQQVGNANADEIFLKTIAWLTN
jgi:hypothetical protein